MAFKREQQSRDHENPAKQAADEEAVAGCAPFAAFDRVWAVAKQAGRVDELGNSERSAGPDARVKTVDARASQKTKADVETAQAMNSALVLFAVRLRQLAGGLATDSRGIEAAVEAVKTAESESCLDLVANEVTRGAITARDIQEGLFGVHSAIVKFEGSLKAAKVAYTQQTGQQAPVPSTSWLEQKLNVIGAGIGLGPSEIGMVPINHATHKDSRNAACTELSEAIVHNARYLEMSLTSADPAELDSRMNRLFGCINTLDNAVDATTKGIKGAVKKARVEVEKLASKSKASNVMVAKIEAARDNISAIAARAK